MKTIYKTLPKIHKACSDDFLRVVMNYVLVTKENVVASNTMILVAHKTKEIFTDDFILNMPERFLIHRKIWEVLSSQHTHICFDKERQLIEFKGKNIDCFFPILFENKIGKYPIWESVIPKEFNPVENIGMDTGLIKQLEESLIYTDEIKKFNFKFSSPEKPILVECKNNYHGAFGIIMPCINK